MSRRVVIVQPYLPTYRVPLFEQLRDRLAANDIECIVAAGQADRVQASRQDAATAEWSRTYRQRRLRLGTRSLSLGGPHDIWATADGVIVGHVGSSLDTLRALTDRRRPALRVGLWGHIRSYVNRPHPLDAAIERWQLRRADHVFAYTPGGAALASKTGVETHRLTTLMNTFDTSSLEREIEGLTDEDVAQFRLQTGVGGATVLGYLGGLDSSKRVDVLVHALDAIWAIDQSTKMLVAGAGQESWRLDAAVARGQVVRLGHVVDARTKALLGATSSVLLNPGRIGLVAVDALVLGRPIVTTDWPYHAPEIEYLEEGVSRFTVEPDGQALAATALRIAHATADRRTWAYPALDSMVDRFSAGIIAMLDGPPVQRRRSEAAN